MTDRVRVARWQPVLWAIASFIVVASGCSSDPHPSTPKSTTPSSPADSAPGPEDSAAQDVTGATSGSGVGGQPPDSTPSTGSP